MNNKRVEDYDLPSYGDKLVKTYIEGDLRSGIERYFNKEYSYLDLWKNSLKLSQVVQDKRILF